MNPDKDTVGPNSDTVNGNEESVHGNENDTENCDEVNVSPQKETVAPNLDTVNGDEHIIHANAETVTPENDNVNPDEDMLNGNHVHIIVQVKTEKIEPEDVKPNLEDSVLHVNFAVTEQSAELFSDCTIKKEESQDDSPISVNGRLSDEVTGNSFEQLVNAAANGKQEDVDVNVSLDTDSAQTLQADDKNTQYSGYNYELHKMYNFYEHLESVSCQIIGMNR